jgi:hypothetical protein
MKKILFLFAAILMGSMTAVEAKITYVPLYIVDTKTDMAVPKHSPSAPLFITQEGYKLTLPGIEDCHMFMVLKDNESVYQLSYQPTVELPTTLIGDYEVRLCADTCYYHGYITLEDSSQPTIPTETDYWDNITLLGSNTSQQAILDNIMGLNVVEYNMKMNINEENLLYLSEEEKDHYIKYREEIHSQRRIGLLPEELRAILPQVVVDLQDGTVGINYLDIVPVLVSCIQELKIQLDTRTEKIVDAMSRSVSPSAVREVRSAIGNTLLSVAPSSANESSRVRFLLTDDVSNAYLTVTDMSGRVMTKLPVSPSDTDASIDSGVLSEGIFLCTLYADGKNIGTKRLVKTK